MANEFRQIPKALLYEMDKEGNIRKVDRKTPILAYPLKSDNVKLYINSGGKEPFLISELIEEVWGNKTKVDSGKKFVNLDPLEETYQEVKEKSERAKDTAQMLSSGKVTKAHPKEAETKPNAEIKQEEKASGKQNSKEVDKIMKINCKMSFKIWKLHESGLSIAEIKAIVKHPHSVGAPATIERYKKNSDLRDKADKAIKLR